MKGWYIPTSPDQPFGESTAFFASFWPFCSSYLTERFGDDWCLSAEQSLNLHVGDRVVPRQVIGAIREWNQQCCEPSARHFNLSLRASIPNAAQVEEKDGIRLFALPSALVNCSPGYFRQYATNARAALASISSASDLWVSF